MSPVTSENVYIAVPPSERMTQVIHLATTAVASRTGLNIDQADDLNTAMDELFKIFLAESDANHSFCVRYDIHSDRLEVRAQGIKMSFSSDANKISRYGKFIFDKVADRFEERPNPNGGFDILLVKFIH